MTTLAQLAGEAGLQVEWFDVAGTRQVVSDDTLRAVLAALDLPAESDAEIEDSRQALGAMRRQGTARFATATIGAPISLPAAIAGPATLHLESGSTQALVLADEGSDTVVMAPIDEPGYHRLVHGAGETILAVAPPRCFGVADMGLDGRPWGASAQLPSLRAASTQGGNPFGDFACLKQSAIALAGKGADLLAISPVHALFPSEPGSFSPYGPSSRMFINVLFADPELAGAQWSATAPAGLLIDWEHAIPQRLADLREIFARLDPAAREALARVERVPLVEQRAHAVFDVLDAHFRTRHIYGWRAWPDAFHDPQGDAVRAFAADHDEDVAFAFWLQGLAERSLAGAQDAARTAGMACGIITDLAVGIDPGGSDAWRRPDAYLHDLSVGAPPDPLGPDGQDWGLTTFNPLTLPCDAFRAFRDTLAAAMAHAGGVRIDHVLGLNRIWVVPRGRTSAEGCYLAFPLQDMLRILALESWRHRAIVVGEDLGTVPAGLREDLREAGVAGMRVLWFERDHDGNFTDPAGWDEAAAAMTSTHDLATLAGWWQGRDIGWTWQIGRKSGFASEADERDHRRHERQRLWARLAQSGHAEGLCPAGDDPDPFVTAACTHVADSACALALVPLEDLFAVDEQPNLPGTTDEHPNWRRRLPASVEALLGRPEISARVAAIAKVRHG